MRAAGRLLLACALLAGPLRAQPADEPARAPASGARVYGVEIESSPARDRVLVFADGAIRPRIREFDTTTVMLHLPGATLDPSAPRSVAAEAGGVVTGVTVFEIASGGEVRLTIKRVAGAAPRMSRRGGQVAIDFVRGGRADARTERRERERTLDARWLNIELSDAITQLARFTGARLIFDDQVTGRVSIDAPDPITEREALALIDSLLLLKGLTAVPAPGGMRKVLPLPGAPAPFVAELAANPGEAAYTTLIRLDELDADLVNEAIQPLVGELGIAQPVPSSNSILLAGPGSRLRRIAQVARELDDGGVRRLVLVPIRYADVVTVADALDAFAEGNLRNFQIWPDERTSRIVMRGRPDDVEEARSFVLRIDRPDTGYGALDVLPVLHADVERMAELLQSLASAEVVSGVVGAASLAGRDFAVSVHRPTHSLVVQTDPDTMRVVADVLAELDRPAESVYVEVGVSEVVLQGSLQLAFDALLPFTDPEDAEDWIGVAVANPSGALQAPNEVGDIVSLIPDGGLRGLVRQAPLLIPLGGDLFLPVPRDNYVLTATEGEARSRLLARPQLLVLSGEEHEIFSGENVPIPNAATGGSGGALEVRQNIERRDTGITLRLEPTVPLEGPIALRLQLEVSQVAGAIAGGIAIRERTIDALVRLEAGQEAFLASASFPTSTRFEAGTPFLKDIPFIGWLFRATRDIALSDHILVTVSARRDRPQARALRRWMWESLDREPPELATDTASATP